ncbi:MAG: pitrilysin family protein [Polyangiaceae bacterium]
MKLALCQMAHIGHRLACGWGTGVVLPSACVAGRGKRKRGWRARARAMLARRTWRDRLLNLGKVGAGLALLVAMMGESDAWAAPRGRGRVAQKKPKTGGKKPKPHAGHGVRPGAYAPAPAMPAAVATSTEVPSRALVSYPLSIERATLENGLRVVLAPDRRSPNVAVTLTYDIGSRVEERGRAGYVQLLSQLMLQGSANVTRGEHARLITSRGGTFSSKVTSEVMSFTSVLPSRELPLALWLEVDRMKSLVLTNDGFEAERSLSAEAAKRLLGQTLAPARQRLRELVFQANWPYEHPVMGVASDIESAQLDTLKEMYESACTPNNAVLTIVGDFENDRAMQLVRRFFETARRRDRGVVSSISQMPDQTSQRSSVLEDTRLEEPAFLFGWAVPAARSEDRAALQMAAEILAGGSASRIGQKVIREKAMALQVSSSLDRTRAQDLLAIEVWLADGQKRAEVEKTVDAEIDSLAKNGPSDAELSKARSTIESSMLRSLESLEERARELSWIETFHGDAGLLKADVEQLSNVSREKVRAAVARYLTPSRRSLVEVLPPPGRVPPLPAPKPAAPVGQPQAMIPQTGAAGPSRPGVPQYGAATPPVSHPLHPVHPKPAKPKKK